VLATLPVYYDAERWGTKEFRTDLRRVLRGYSRQTGVPFVDAAATESRLPQQLWADGDHLNPNGARRFSEMLAGLLARHLAAPGRPGC
jgi:lysophospholipase L1-like esterase